MRMAKVAVSALGMVLSASALAVGSMTDLTVYDRSEGRTLPVHWHEGRPWVVGKPGNEYQIQLRNRRAEDLLAVVSVDGVNVVSGETADPRQGGYIVASWRSLEVKGWRKSLERTAAFYFTSLPDSYAARTGRAENVGVIGVALFQRLRPQPPASIAPQPFAAPSADSGAPAAREPRSEAAESMRRRDARLGTGHGRNEASPARWAEFERASDVPVETIALYYDSYRNLVARGVIREPRPVPRIPDPFPAFVPDPPSG